MLEAYCRSSTSGADAAIGAPELAEEHATSRAGSAAAVAVTPRVELASAAAVTVTRGVARVRGRREAVLAHPATRSSTRPQPALRTRRSCSAAAASGAVAATARSPRCALIGVRASALKRAAASGRGTWSGAARSTSARADVGRPRRRSWPPARAGRRPLPVLSARSATDARRPPAPAPRPGAASGPRARSRAAGSATCPRRAA